ncbi:MAG: AAA family ATPase [Chloroflexota bacterium]|nr:AAA family ATPase [Chloroflexota bacterium]
MSVQCPACDAENPVSARFCASCGGELPTRCPRCGATVPTGAQYCPACGQVLDGEPAPEERKLATALFVDLVDSTALGEQLDPERLRSILHTYFSLVASTTQAWGGTVEKYIGDAVVAVFGVPRVREDDAARAVSAAAEIAERIHDVAADVERKYKVSIALRIGVNTGEVIAPSQARPDRPMVTGDAINVAARLQSAADPGAVLVGDRTFQSTRLLFQFKEPVELLLKGKEHAVIAHALIGRIPGAVEAGPARNLQARVIGRDRELAVLGGLLDEVIETRTPRLAMVYGPAGVGKSRLVREAVTLGASERPDLTILRGRCPAIGQGLTYWPLAEIVRAACGISLDDGGGQAQEKLRSRVSGLLAEAGVPGDEAEGTIFALATTAGIALPDNPLDRSRPIGVVTELARRWPQFLSAVASARPIAVIIEDLHWASDQVIEMVERLLARSTGAILLVATARPEFSEAHPTFATGLSDAATISLRPLNRAQGASLLDGLLPAHNLPPGIEDQILDTAEGNPLFVEEIVSRLIESGALRLESGGWRSVTDDQGLAIPDTIHGLLAARIDALPEIERRVLCEASVVGRVFWEEPVAAAVSGEEVTDAIGNLEHRGLIAMRPISSLGDKIEYAFKHALIRDVAYAGLPLARRCRAHAAVGAWLATLSPDRPEELAELIALHYRAALGDGAELVWPADSAELAEVQQRAKLAFLAAGAAARKRFAIDLAVDLHQRALDLATTDEERATAFEELGGDYDADYDGDRAIPAWNEAIALRTRLPEPGQVVARIAMKAARAGAIRWGGFSVPMEPDVIDRYVETGLAAGPDAETRAWLRMLRAAAGLRWIAFHRADPVPLEERVRAGEEARAHAEAVGDASLEAQSLLTVGSILLAHGNVERGLELTGPLLRMAEHIADPRERHLVTIETAQTRAWIAGEAESVIEPLIDALRVGRELRVHDLCHSTATLISALYLSGRWEEIPGYLEEHLRAFQTDAAGTTCPFALGAFQLGATVLAHRGEIERAREVAALMPKSEAPVGIVEALQATLANALGDPATARSIAEQVIATGARNFAEEPPVELAAKLDAVVALEDWAALRDFLPEVRRRSAELALAGPAADRAEGLALVAAGDMGQAGKLLRAAIARFDQLSLFEAAQTREGLAAIEPAQRQMLLGDALEAYERLGARPHAQRIRTALAEQPSPSRR